MWNGARRLELGLPTLGGPPSRPFSGPPGANLAWLARINLLYGTLGTSLQSGRASAGVGVEV